ncbi:MAG TPA: type II toxin-antitoxin system VapC family toxin [Pyrinomonadaceae bacterium]|nr:type II toxin-antitoxin system VapC family toxin [Pyrinomonadaceae bacterium]
MSGTKSVLDSNAIIHASKGTIDAEQLLTGSENYYVSIITLIEVYAYDFGTSVEKVIIDEILDSLEIVELGKEIAEQTIIYRKNKNKKIKLPDAVILATAKFINADLITNNVSDFLSVDPSVNVVNLDEFKP